jgi:hypothetical protein
VRELRGNQAGGQPITGDLLPALPDGPAPGAPAQLPTVEITGAKEALVVAPDEILVVLCSNQSVAELEWMVDQCRAAGLGPRQVVFMNGDGIDRLAKIRREPDGTTP